MKVAIILVNYNSSDLTLSCLKSLDLINKDQFEVKIFVVDNNSKENFQIRIENYKTEVEIIKNLQNLGFSGGINVGVKKAIAEGGEYILILNNDTTHDSSFLKNLISAIRKQKVDIISPKIYYSKGREYHKGRYKENELGKIIWFAGGNFDPRNILVHHRGVDEVDHGQYDKNLSSDIATGCAMLIKKEVIEKIGFLDEKYFLYLEDLEYSVRAKKFGFRIGFAPNSVIFHYNAGSTEGSGSYLHDYFITRNRLLFALSYSTYRTKLALLRESLRLLATGRRWQKRGVKDFYLGRFGKGSIDR